MGVVVGVGVVVYFCKWSGYLIFGLKVSSKNIDEKVAIDLLKKSPWS